MLLCEVWAKIKAKTYSILFMQLCKRLATYCAVVHWVIISATCRINNETESTRKTLFRSKNIFFFKSNILSEIKMFSSIFGWNFLAPSLASYIYFWHELDDDQHGLNKKINSVANNGLLFINFGQNMKGHEICNCKKHIVFDEQFSSYSLHS